MKAERTLERLRRGALREVAHDLGFELPRGRYSLLASFRRDAARVSIEHDYDRGYRDALLDLVEAYGAATADTRDRREAAARLSELDRRLLQLLARGPQTSTQLAETAGPHRSTVSRHLEALRQIGATVAHDDDTADGRCRHHRLTPFGRRVLDANPALPAELDEGVRLAVWFVGSLLTRGRVPHRSLRMRVAATCGRVVARADAVWETVVSRVQEAGLLRDADGLTWAAAETGSESPLWREINDAMAAGEPPGAAFYPALTPLKARLAGDIERIYLRADQADRWRVYVHDYWPALWGPEAPPIEPVSSTDLAVGLSGVPQRYAILYETRSLFHLDRTDAGEQGGPLERLVRGARQRLVIEGADQVVDLPSASEPPPEDACAA
ncbi:MAG: ArsR family transcriptional regulator [Myxococcales bacterium]|nr:ArsR family transcriptional regulator [Myxococcales bacterium]